MNRTNCTTTTGDEDGWVDEERRERQSEQASERTEGERVRALYKHMVVRVPKLGQVVKSFINDITRAAAASSLAL